MKIMVVLLSSGSGRLRARCGGVLPREGQPNLHRRAPVAMAATVRRWWHGGRCRRGRLAAPAGEPPSKRRSAREPDAGHGWSRVRGGSGNPVGAISLNMKRGRTYWRIKSGRRAVADHECSRDGRGGRPHPVPQIGGQPVLDEVEDL